MLNFVNYPSSTVRRATPYKQRRMRYFQRQDLVHQKKLHSAATDRLQSRMDDLQVQVTKLVQTLDHKRTAAEGTGAVDMRI